jgi:hypothetical protein
MTRLTLALAAVAAGLVLPATAAAKGPSAAAISGPGLGKTIKIGGSGESSGTPLGDLTMQAGFFPAAFGQSPDPMLPGKPAGKLGPSFAVRYVVPGPNGHTYRIRQDLYPYAAGGAVTYMKPGQAIFDGTTRGGWFRADSTLRQLLVRRGLPARAPRGSGTRLGLLAGIGIPGVLVLAGSAALLARRRRTG